MVWLQGWMTAVQASRDKGITTAVVAAAAMFVLVVTRSNERWASWSERDNTFVRYNASHSHKPTFSRRKPVANRVPPSK